jgi:hypothetical protein
MEVGVRKWSDLSPYIRFVEEDIDMDDALALVLEEICRLRNSTGTLDLEGVRAQLEARLIDLRHTGPEHLPRYFVKLLHSDLAIDAEFEHALRNRPSSSSSTSMRYLYGSWRASQLSWATEDTQE